MNPLLAQLAERRMFVLARADKHPCDIEGHDSNAQDPSTWLTAGAAATYAELLGLHTGIVLSDGCGLVCIDIDSALQPDDTWAPIAVDLCQRFRGAYVEVSLGGRGLHIFASYTGTLPQHGTRWTPPGAPPGLHVEVFSTRRYILTTGRDAIGDARSDHTAALHALIAEHFVADGDANADDAEWTDGPVEGSRPIADDAALIASAMRSMSPAAAFGRSAPFVALWTREVDVLARVFPPQSPGQDFDGSAADLALAGQLAFYTGGDCDRIARLMEQSMLKRDKWERVDYLRGTILKACASTRQWYTGGVGAQGADAAGTDEPGPTERDPRPVVLLRSGDFDRYTTRAEQLLADAIYVHGHGLARIGRASEISNDAQLDTAGTKREAAQAVCIPASAGWLRRALMERAQFWKYDKRAREWERRDAPKEITENIADQQAWSTFRPLVTISPVPVLRPDMSVWVQPGYDAVTGVFHQPNIATPPIPPTPTRDDALRALARLMEPFDQFPYASPESATVFVSHVISAVLRASFDTSPIFVYTSPIAATGKTLLADMPNIIAQGINPAHSPYSESEELRKVLFSSLLAGDPALTLDNVPNGHKVRAAGLCVFVTSATYSDRILGVSETRKVPNRCTVTLTGNNITPVGDMARRSLVCRLDANAESARGRTFRIRDLRGHVRQHRAQSIVDVLTIVRAYAFAGWPEVAHPLESFEAWSRLVRDPLVWLGMTDPVASQSTETDDELAPLQGAFTAIAGATRVQGQTFTGGQLASMSTMHPGLREALINAGCAEPADAKKLGYWLREQKDRVASGMKLVSERGAHGGVAGWRLRAT